VDDKLELISYADDLILNLNQVRYVFIVEVLEEGRKQHSLAQSIFDEERERNIRNLLNIYNVLPIPNILHLIQMAYFFTRVDRMEAVQTRIKEMRDTLSFMLENKFNGTKWIGN
jgi:hypothetical protein